MKGQQDKSIQGKGTPIEDKVEKAKGESLSEKLCRVRSLMAGCLAVARFLEIDTHGAGTDDEIEVVERWHKEGHYSVISDTGRLLQRELGEAQALACEMQDAIDLEG